MAFSQFSAASLFGVPNVVAVVTGGGSGLGAIAAHALAANGAKAVFVIGRRKSALVETKQKSPNPDLVHPIVCDITHKESLTAAVERIRAQVGYIDVLFANSGVSKAGTGPMSGSETIDDLQQKLWKPDMADFSETMHVNVTGSFYTVVAFLGLLDEGNKRAVAATKSQVVLTTSVAGFSRVPFAGFSYSASKAAVTHMTKQLSTVLAPYKIRVNGIAPGFFPSEMTQNLPFMKGDKNPREEGALDAQQAPLQRVGTEEEFAGIILFLASKAGGYIDGNVILSDGGRIGIVPSMY